MGRFATSVANIKQSHYPVVVIGSGYGGAIAASRLARAGQLVVTKRKPLESGYTHIRL